MSLSEVPITTEPFPDGPLENCSTAKLLAGNPRPALAVWPCYLWASSPLSCSFPSVRNGQRVLNSQLCTGCLQPWACPLANSWLTLKSQLQTQEAFSIPPKRTVSFPSQFLARASASLSDSSFTCLQAAGLDVAVGSLNTGTGSCVSWLPKLLAQHRAGSQKSRSGLSGRALGACQHRQTIPSQLGLIFVVSNEMAVSQNREESND